MVQKAAERRGCPGLAPERRSIKTKGMSIALFALNSLQDAWIPKQAPRKARTASTPLNRPQRRLLAWQLLSRKEELVRKWSDNRAAAS